jgi:hypothetical protein
MIFFFNSSLNCEETNKEDSTENNSENKNTKLLRLCIIMGTIAFQLGVSPEEPAEDKIKYLIVLGYIGVVSTMFGRWLSEKVYGNDPIIQAKVQEDIIKEIDKLIKNEE